ncbi:MAG: sulfurtransferase [Pseudomonadota bacterium]
MTRRFSTLIDCDELRARITFPWCRVVECRFDLNDASAGRTNYLEAHIAGAVFADLDVDLSDHSRPDSGRHPLPDKQAIIALARRLGISDGDQVVCYDDSGGMFAARLWWMLRWVGFPSVAVLSGGWQTWVAAGAPIDCGEQFPSDGGMAGGPAIAKLALMKNVSGAALVDAREAPRFEGVQEPLDPVAGHIPGAGNHFWKTNLADSGKFLEPHLLKAKFSASLGMLPHADSVHYCGSGVSACHNVLAQVHAGLAEPFLYAGSWSEWCRYPENGVATGAGMDS